MTGFEKIVWSSLAGKDNTWRQKKGGAWVLEKSHVESIIAGCIDRLNEQLPGELRMKVSPDLVIVGEGSALDSLSLVVLLVDIEEQVSSRFGWTLRILDDGIGGDTGSKFHNLSELTEWVWSHR